MFLEVVRELFLGFLRTCEIFSMTLIFAIPLGLVFCFFAMSKNKLIKNITRTIIWIIRGIPLMLQLIIVYYIPGLLFNTSLLPKMTAVIIAFSINYAAYFAEIYRAGIQSTPVGQYEAAQVLGLTKVETFTKVVFKPLVKKITPPMGNEVITLVKDTALANVIIVAELIYTAKRVQANTGQIWPLFFTAIFYLIFVGVLTLLLNRLEGKLAYIKE